MKFQTPDRPSLADFPHLVTHSSVPGDPFDQPAGDPPREAFDQAGAEVEAISWDNRGVRRSYFPMAVTPFENPTLQRFREKYDFLEVIRGVEDEWERLLLLRNWVRRKIPPNNNAGPQNSLFKRPYPDSSFGLFRTLDTAGAGCCWWCPHYGSVLRAVLTACGYVARHVGNISPHSMQAGARTHGVVDCFVQKFGKWVQLDANYDCHYVIDGVPLSPWELGEAWSRDGGAEVTVHAGPEGKRVDQAMGPFEGEHEACRAYWNQHRWNTDPFSSHGTWYGRDNAQLVLTLVGARHEGVLAYRGRSPGSEVDAAYADGRIQYTTRAADVYPDVGTSQLTLSKGPHGGTVSVTVGAFAPNLASIEVAADDRSWSDQDARFEWYLHTGENILRVRTRDKFGNRGRVSSVRVTLRAHS